jgi:hypothetical protein
MYANISANTDDLWHSSAWRPPAAVLEWISTQHSGFELGDYLQVLGESNGLGEVFAQGTECFVHNMLLILAEEALDVSEKEFGGKALAIGYAGVDGILFLLQPSRLEVFAYYPMDEEFKPLAGSLPEFLRKCAAGEVCL